LMRSIYSRHVVQGRMSPPTENAVLRFSRAIQNEHYRNLIDKVGHGIRSKAVHSGRHVN